MQRLIWILGLWLVGIGQAAALDVMKPESLNYRVYWGVLRVGDARITYTPTSTTYVVRAEVKDTSSLIDLNDSWESRGKHTTARAFVPSVYKVKQAENSYHADKDMVFDRVAQRVVYTNHIDPTDKAEPVVLGEGDATPRDILATVFAWRVVGLPMVQTAGRTEAVTVKKIVTLQRDAGHLMTLKLGKRDVRVWRVRLTTLKDGKPGKSNWIVYLQNTPDLTPVQIVAATKFGTFTASLAQ